MRHQGRFSAFLKGYGRLTVLLIPIGIATNFVGGQIASLLKLPVFLDSIGTILVGALCGGLPGMLVGLLSNLINSITAPTLIPFALLNMMLGLLAGLLSRLGAFKSLGRTIAAAFPLALASGVVGGLISIWVFGGLAANGLSIVIAGLHALGMDLNTAVFVAGLPLEFVDKLATLLIVFLIISRVPTRLLVKVPLGGKYLDRPKRRKSIEIPEDEMAMTL